MLGIVCRQLQHVVSPLFCSVLCICIVLTAGCSIYSRTVTVAVAVAVALALALAVAVAVAVVMWTSRRRWSLWTGWSLVFPGNFTLRYSSSSSTGRPS